MALCLLWDLVFDWGLLSIGFQGNNTQKNGLKILISRDTIFGVKLYIFLAFLNLLLRLFVSFSLPLASLLGIELPYLISIVLFAEVLRRTIWNICRLEHEHRNNSNALRAFRTEGFYSNQDVAPLQLEELFYHDMCASRLETPGDENSE